MINSSTSVPDLNLTAYVAFASNVLPPLQVKTPALKPVLDAFTTSVVRLQNILLLPGAIAFYSARLQNQADRAELAVTGTVGKHTPIAPQPPKVDVVEYFRKILLQEAEEDTALFGTSEGTRRTLAATLLGFQTIELSFGRHPDINLAVQAVLSSYITAMWTIFESLAEDLWEAALNHMPEGLVELKGKKRYKRNAFRGLQGIKDAYEAAFYTDSDSIHGIIQSEVFKRLSALRNMIVHSSGIADDEYMQRTRETAGLPDLQRGEQLRLDGTMIVDLLSGTTNQARALILAVDHWLDDHAISPD
jgi:hypothetical protein